MEQLRSSIYQLDINAFNDSLEKIDPSELMESDILGWLLHSLETVKMEAPVTLGCLNYSEFRDLHQHPDNMDGMLKLMLILSNLLRLHPQIVKPDHLQLVTKWNVPTFINMISQYSNGEEIQECYICAESYRYQLISSPCSCKHHIHLPCLIKMVSTNGDLCKTCRSSLGSKNYGDIIYFPKIHIYPSNQRDESHTIVEGDLDRLHHSIIYGEGEVLISLLENISEDQITAYLIDQNYISHHQIRDGLIRFLNLKNNLDDISILESLFNSKILELGIKLKTEEVKKEEIKKKEQPLNDFVSLYPSVPPRYVKTCNDSSSDSSDSEEDCNSPCGYSRKRYDFSKRESPKKRYDSSDSSDYKEDCNSPCGYSMKRYDCSESPKKRYDCSESPKKRYDCSESPKKRYDSSKCGSSKKTYKIGVRGADGKQGPRGKDGKRGPTGKAGYGAPRW